jgi:hypothetical protein
MLVSDTGCCAQKAMKHSKKQGASNRTHPPLPKATDNSDLYNRAFPVGNALFLFAGGVVSLFRLPIGRLAFATALPMTSPKPEFCSI